MHKFYSSFEDLTKSALHYLKEIGRGKQTISIYNWVWKKVKNYMDANHIENCTSGVIADYLNLTYGSLPLSLMTRHQKHCLRCALCLAQFLETNKMIEIINRREVISLSGEIGNQITEYVQSKRSLRLHEKTLRNHSYNLYQLLKYFTSCEIHTCNSISPLSLMKYTANLLPKSAGARHVALSIIKSFLRYLYDNKMTIRDFSIIIPRDNYKKQPKLPSTYTKEEVLKILGSIDRSTSTGKRNYAILMLAVRLGMRASDISNLKFCHLLWAENSITFDQYKTNTRIVLPLPSDVGEAIIDYIKYARPTSDDIHLFLEKQYPNYPICSKSVSKMATRSILESGVVIGNRKHGSHALRHTMASFLLEQNTPLPVISELLGHASIQTSMCYLRIDIESLRQCALEVPVVPEAFYTQKGGSFYA